MENNIDFNEYGNADSDRAFTEAFNNAVKDLEGDTKASALPFVQEQFDKDSSVVSEQNDQLEEVEDTDLSVDDDDYESSIEETPETSPETDIDYKAMYLKQQQMADAQIGLLHSRLNEVSSRYQELKKSAKQTLVVDEIIPDKMPKKIQEVLGNYDPELADAIQELINYKFGKTQTRLKSEIDSRVEPLQQQLAQTEAQRHEQTIRSSHPDISQILQSGDLFTWMNSLPPLMKSGATQVYQNGSAEEVVTLLNEYKQARGISNAIPSRKVSSDKHGTSAQNAAAPRREKSRASAVRADSKVTDEETNRRLVSALGIPSNRGSIELKERPTFQEEFDMYARQYETSRRLR